MTKALKQQTIGDFFSTKPITSSDTSLDPEGTSSAISDSVLCQTTQTTQVTGRKPAPTSTSTEAEELSGSNVASVERRASGSTTTRASKRLKREEPSAGSLEVDTSVPSSSPSKTKTTKKRGKLSILPLFPLDILYEIFALLAPLDLLHLSRTTKALRGVLLHRSATTIWMRSLRGVEGLPPCPEDMAPPAFASLVFDRFCHSCLKRTESVWFVLRVRYCAICEKSMLVSIDQYPKMREILRKAVPCERAEDPKEAKYNAIKTDVEAFLAKWKKRAVLGDPLTAERALVAKREKIGAQLSKWQDDRDEARLDDNERLRDEREEAIEAKLDQLGYSKELRFYRWLWDDCVIDPWPVHIPAFHKHPHVNQPRALTERIWKNIESDMVKLMLTMREYMVETERTKVIRARRKVMHGHYLEWRTSDDIMARYPAHYLMPGPVDIMEHPCFKATLELPSTVSIGEWTKMIETEFLEHLPTLIPRWRLERVNFFINALDRQPTVTKPLVEHPSPNLEGSSMRTKHEQLQLATVVFRCTDEMMHWVIDGTKARDDGCGTRDPKFGFWRRDGTAEPAHLLWYPAFLTHACATTLTYEPQSRRPPPEGFLCLNSVYDYHDTTWKTALYQKAWAEEFEFDVPASRTTLNILKACGMSETTTVQELDERDPRLVCLRCSSGKLCDGERPMRVFGWREAVNHSVNNHFGSRSVHWQCLSPTDSEEAKRLETIECAKKNYPTSTTEKVWRCTACLHTRRDSGRMTRESLQSHFHLHPGFLEFISFLPSMNWSLSDLDQRPRVAEQRISSDFLVAVMATPARILYMIAATLLFAFATIEMALSAYLISKYNTNDYLYSTLSIRTRVRYALFISIWTMIFSFIYIVITCGSPLRAVMGFGSIASHLFFLAIGWIMWLGSAISISDMLGGVLHCSTNSLAYCTQLNALQAFAWLIFSWITVVFLAIVVWAVGRMRKNEWPGYGSPLFYEV